MDSEGVFRAYRSDVDRERHEKFLPKLSDAGVSPTIIELNELGRVLERLQTLPEWLGTASWPERVEMRRNLLQNIDEMHRLGVCHRDLHPWNVLVRDDAPLFIDLELATEVDPNDACFDLIGPESGVAVAEQHRNLAGWLAFCGVWWDSPAGGLGWVFGPLR